MSYEHRDSFNAESKYKSADNSGRSTQGEEKCSAGVEGKQKTTVKTAE